MKWLWSKKFINGPVTTTDCSLDTCGGCNTNNLQWDAWRTRCWRTVITTFSGKPCHNTVGVDRCSSCNACLPGAGGTFDIAINIDRSTQNSDWQLHKFYVWNNHLNDSAWQQVNTLLWSYATNAPCPPGQFIINGGSQTVVCGNCSADTFKSV